MSAVLQAFMTMATTEPGQEASPTRNPRERQETTERPPQNYPPSVTTTAPRATSSVAIATANANARAQAVHAVAELPMAHNSYDELHLIGNGAYGTVYLGRDKTNDDRLVALKKIRITLTDEGVPVNALREIALLKQLEKFEHPNIVKLLDICHGRIERDSRLTLILVFEYVEQDLDNFMKNSPPPSLEPQTIKSLMHQVLCGVDFLHTNRIIHRDLKPQNLLVDRFNRVKIADFGLARIYDFHMKLTTMVVTLWYRAPEVLLSNSYATPVDVWSCGCIFAELYRRRPMFEGQTEGDQLQRIFDVIGRPLESEWPRDVSLSLDNFRDHVGRPLVDLVPEISPDGVDLLRKLLKFVPGSRISAKDALNHPYFRGMTTPKVTSTTSRPTPTTTPTPAPAPRLPSTPSSTSLIQMVSPRKSPPMKKTASSPTTMPSPTLPSTPSSASLIQMISPPKSPPITKIAPSPTATTIPTLPTTPSSVTLIQMTSPSKSPPKMTSPYKFAKTSHSPTTITQSLQLSSCSTSKPTSVSTTTTVTVSTAVSSITTVCVSSQDILTYRSAPTCSISSSTTSELPVVITNPVNERDTQCSNNDENNPNAGNSSTSISVSTNNNNSVTTGVSPPTAKVQERVRNAKRPRSTSDPLS